MGKYGKYRPLVKAGALLLALWPAAVLADCRLALLLALDTSTSVNPAEDRLQREGLAAALLDEDVVAAFPALPQSPVALSVYGWSGRFQQAPIVGWMQFETLADAERAAQLIHQSQRVYSDYPTAIGSSLSYAANVFRGAPNCLSRTLDISGDGVNNDGFSPALAYAHFPLNAVVVNGLVIGGGTQDDAAVLDFYRQEVIRGPGAFVEFAGDFRDFERAMRRKLMHEVGNLVVGAAVPEFWHN